MPVDDLQEVISYFVEYEEDLPSDDAKFHADLLPGYSRWRLAGLGGTENASLGSSTHH